MPARRSRAARSRDRGKRPARSGDSFGSPRAQSVLLGLGTATAAGGCYRDASVAPTHLRNASRSTLSSTSFAGSARNAAPGTLRRKVGVFLDHHVEGCRERRGALVVPDLLDQRRVVAVVAATWPNRAQLDLIRAVTWMCARTRRSPRAFWIREARAACRLNSSR